MLHHSPVSNLHSREGYTLIEIVIYMAIFSLVIGGLLMLTYGIVQGSSTLQSSAIIHEEGEFLMRKFNWALTGANDINIPSPDRLEITNANFTPSNLVFTYSSGRVFLDEGGAGAVALTSEDVVISPFIFTDIGSGGAQGAKMEFTVTHFQKVSKDFESIKYLRL